MHYHEPSTEDKLVPGRTDVFSNSCHFGILWTMGILGAIFEYIVIDYVFIALCSLQGFCVAVAQLTTRWIRTENREYRRQKS